MTRFPRALPVVICFACAAWSGRAVAQSGYFGAANISIDPSTAIRLSGYAGRIGLPEAQLVDQHITAQALAFGMGAETSIMMSVDATGVPDNVVDSVISRLQTNHGLAPERIVISSTHTHSGPVIDGYLDNLFGGPLSPVEQQHVDLYTAELAGWLEQVALSAMNNRTPGHELSWGIGSAGFGQNRRGTAIAPNDHDLPVMRVADAVGNTAAIVTSYATHATTLDPEDNTVSGDWPGYAREYIEQNYPGAVALVMIGAGADSNPAPRVGGNGVAYAQDHGQTIANEVDRLIGQGFMQPVSFDIGAKHGEVLLDYATSAAPGDPGGLRLAPTGTPPALYGITSWTFGNDLAMVFLEGEVVVDYSSRLKSELGDGRLWVTAYSGDVQGYIPSERILYEGGYEADSSSYYYGLPGRFAHGIEDKIVGEVTAQLQSFFFPPDRLTLAVDLATGAVALRNNWTDPLELDGYTIQSASAALDASDARWSSLADQGFGGWDEADNSGASRLTEFNPAGALTLLPGASVSLGAPYTVNPPAALGDEISISQDVVFQYTFNGAESPRSGVIEYAGAGRNNLVLTIDPATGEAALRNESPFFDALVDGYTIASAAGNLDPAGWSSLAKKGLAGWDEADNSGAFRVTEFNPSSASLFSSDGDPVFLGALFDLAGGPFDADDLSFTFTLADGTTLEGIVVLGALPIALPGDANGDGLVDIFDVAVVSNHWGTSGPAGDVNRDGAVDIFDVALISNNWGATSRGHPVPEPSTAAIALTGCLAAVARRRLSGLE